MIHFHMQRFKFIDFMIIQLRFFKKKNKKNMDKMWKALLEILRMSYIIISTNFVYCNFNQFFTFVQIESGK